MKLKLHTLNTETLKTTLSLISPIRKFVILRFSPLQLQIILVNGQSISLEPQVWCKLQIGNLFDQIEVQSLRDNTILLEINVELLLQTLRNFDKANSDSGLNIILQKKELTGQQGITQGNSRTASLALYYSDININTNTVNHTFRIPVKILKNTHEAILLREPELENVDLMMKLPNEFVNTYKRLDKFKKSESSGNNNTNDLMTIRSSRRNGGYLAFVLQEEGIYKVTISWNKELMIQKPVNSNFNSDSMQNVLEEYSLQNEGHTNAEETEVENEITVRLKDWRMASKIVATCHTVIFLISHGDSCVLHCYLDESNEVEIIYYVSGVRSYD